MLNRNLFRMIKIQIAERIMCLKPWSEGKYKENPFKTVERPNSRQKLLKTIKGKI